MTKVIFCDLKQDLVKEIKKLGIKAICGDYFKLAEMTDNPVLMTASNPLFTFGGGIDYGFAKRFPKLCEEKRYKGGENERIGNICFTITVDEHCKSSKNLVEEALKFAFKATKKNETLLVSGIGTGIGQLNTQDFLEVFSNALN